MPDTAYLSLVATHLNAPYGAVVRPQDVAAAFRTGNLDSVPASDVAKALLATMFVELSPEIVGRACFEAGVRLEEAQALYEHVRKEWDGARSLAAKLDGIDEALDHLGKRPTQSHAGANIRSPCQPEFDWAIRWARDKVAAWKTIAQAPHSSIHRLRQASKPRPPR